MPAPETVNKAKKISQFSSYSSRPRRLLLDYYFSNLKFRLGTLFTVSQLGLVAGFA